eukprot:6517283-Prorocentrum_lima.AAC.1
MDEVAMVDRLCLDVLSYLLRAGMDLVAQSAQWYSGHSQALRAAEAKARQLLRHEALLKAIDRTKH